VIVQAIVHPERDESSQGQRCDRGAAGRPTVLDHCATRRPCQPGGVFEHGGGGARATLVSGCFGFDAAENPLIAALPPVIHVASDHAPPQRWLEASLQFISDEMASGQLGAQTVVGRLADILLVQAIRAHLAQGGDALQGWLRALLDPQISSRAGADARASGRGVTVETLAARVAMSRSAFAARFSSLVGEPPLTYLTRWHMHKASRLLATSLLRIHEIAAQLGYKTESAFHKAFKRSLGVAPSVYRRTKMNGAEPAAESP
jgi:AraC-like DNA-binding protein